MAVLLLVAGLGVNATSRRKGINDLAWPLQLSRMIWAGQAAYDPTAVRSASLAYQGADLTDGLSIRPMYPPSTGVVLLPLAAIPWKVANVLYFPLAYAALAFGLWGCLRVFAPQWPAHWRLLALGLATCMACVRWAFTSYQLGPLVVWAACQHAIALRERRGRAVVLWAALGMSLKATLGLPFFGVALALRRFRWAATILILFAALNLLGFARTGGAGALRQMLDNQAYMTSLGLVTNAPDPHVPGSPPRLDGQFLLNGFVSAPAVNRVLTGLLTLGVVGWLVLGWRGWASLPDDTALRLFTAVLTPLGLFAVYHHHYDIIVMLVPVAMLLTVDASPVMDRWRRIYLASALLYSSFFAISLANGAERASPSLGVFVKVLGAVSVALALGAGLRMLSLASREPTGSSQPSAAPT